MSSLLRAKRILEDVAGPVRFERGEWSGSHRETMGATHPILASVTVLGERVTGTGCCHLCAVEDLSETLRARTLRAIRDSLGCRLDGAA